MGQQRYSKLEDDAIIALDDAHSLPKREPRIIEPSEEQLYGTAVPLG